MSSPVEAQSAAARARLGPALSWVALCLVLAGTLVYVYLALVARALPTAQYGWFGAFWSLTLLIGLGAFLPIELELTRLVHLRPAGAPLPRGTLRAVGAVAGVAVVAVLAGWPLLAPALGNQIGLLWALLTLCVLSGAQFVLRGLLLGNWWVGRHGSVLLVDSALRVAAAAVVAATVAAPSAADFGWTLVVAIGLAHVPLLVVLLARRRRQVPPAAAGSPLRVRALGHLLVATLAAQALLNAAPVLVTRAATPAEQALAASFVAGFTLVRLPLFVAVPLQSTLLPALTEVSATTDQRTQHRLVVRATAGVAAVAVLAALLAAVVGPPVIDWVFGPRYALPRADLAVMAAGSIFYLGLLLVTQALVASARHRDGAMAWVSGLVVAAVLFAVVPDLLLRASVAFGGGSAAGLAVATAVLLLHRAPASTSLVGDPR